MKDLISRQDAIDAFGLSEKTRKYGGDHSGYDYRLLYEIQDILEGLPSAQPERKIELHGDESAIEILSELRSWFSCFDEKEGLAYHALSLAIRAIKENSAARSERKGKWIDSRDVSWMCSECGKWLDVLQGDVDMNFCPNCGADMRGEQE
ncbi:MAG: hypothetical protein IJH71_00190 [Eubacterium sp.]|nr:hypothetical protein [Eubacterium sp.]